MEAYPDFFEVKVDPIIPVTGGTKTSDDDGKTWKDAPGPPIFLRIYHSKTDPFLQELLKELPAPSVKNLRHKIKAVRYHKERYLAAETEEVDRLQHLPPSQGADSVLDDPEAIYDLEGFLFQVKSCLDVAMLVLKNRLAGRGRDSIKGFNSSGNVAGEKTVTALNRYIVENHVDENIKPIQEILLLIAQIQPWSSELVDMRDKVTHFARLETLWFIQEAYLIQGKSRIRFPRLPDNVRDIRTSQYIDETWEKLIDFLQKYLDIIRQMK